MAKDYKPLLLNFEDGRTGFSFAIEPGLDEDHVWSRFVLPLLGGLGVNDIDIWWFAVTEMVNNAIDHSNGSRVIVVVERKPLSTRITVQDDGIGIFRKLREAFSLADDRRAILELAKGKLTTDPDHHSGQGIFLTSRVLDRFKILSQGAFFSHDASMPADWIMDNESTPGSTMVDMALENNTDRTLKDVFDQYSSGEDYDFSKTIIPLRLAKLGSDKLISRSQAKAALARIDRFRSVVFDFGGIEMISQAFADEMFRVWPNAHQDVAFTVIYANADVRKMIAAVPPAPNVSY
jgi:anti-sigma regulatory factor (Ser/Thr protein kinase)